MAHTSPPDGSEPALQLLVLPRRDAEPLPKYAPEASHLSPLHCRLCLEDLQHSEDNVETSIALIPKKGDADALHPRLVKHLHDVHGVTQEQHINVQN